ncbi:MAG: hypothetical protein KUG79_08940 [Pseudomonadales bacterium]|nr:hypothetical protein [Pseudomonadales bacterium]
MSLIVTGVIVTGDGVKDDVIKDSIVTGGDSYRQWFLPATVQLVLFSIIFGIVCVFVDR